MTPRRFARLLDTYGPDQDRWPAVDRAAARDLLAGSADARAALAEARALDAQLARGLPVPAPEALARLQDGVARRIARLPLPARPDPWDRVRVLLRPAAPVGWGAVAAMATCAVWLSVGAAPSAGDPLAPLQTLPIAEDPL
jgi:hypothetical protein